MAQFDLTVRVTWFNPDPSFGSSTYETTENISVEVESEAAISDADIRAALAAVTPAGAQLSGYTVEGVFAPESGGTITVYAAAKFICADGRTVFRTFRIDVPTTSTRDEVLDEMLLTILARMDIDPAGYDCTYAGFEITAPLLYAYSIGG